MPGTQIAPDALAAIYIRFPGREFTLLGAIGAERPSAVFAVGAEGGDGGGGSGGVVGGGGGGGEEVDMDAEDEGPFVANESSISAGGGAAPKLFPPPAQPPPLSPQGQGPAQLPIQDIVLGISIEPASLVLPQLSALLSSSTSAPSLSTSTYPSTTHALVSRPATSSTTALVPSLPPSLPPSLSPSTKVLAQRIIKNAFNFLASFAGGEEGREMVPLKSFRDWWVKFEKRVELDPGFLERDVD